MPTPVTIRPISNLKDLRDRSVVVTDTETGKDIRLPRQVIDFVPGGVIIPLWLSEKIFKKGDKNGNKRAASSISRHTVRAL